MAPRKVTVMVPCSSWNVVMRAYSEGGLTLLCCATHNECQHLSLLSNAARQLCSLCVLTSMVLPSLIMQSNRTSSSALRMSVFQISTGSKSILHIAYSPMTPITSWCSIKDKGQASPAQEATLSVDVATLCTLCLCVPTFQHMANSSAVSVYCGSSSAAHVFCVVASAPSHFHHHPHNEGCVLLANTGPPDRATALWDTPKRKTGTPSISPLDWFDGRTIP